MRNRRTVLLGALLLLVLLLLWRLAPRNHEPDDPLPEAAPTSPSPSPRTADPIRPEPSRLRAAVIAGRVLVEDGTLPPAQVCVQPAELAQDRGGWGHLSQLSFLARCVDLTDGGHYRLDDMLPGRWVVFASAEGYAPVQHQETPAQPWISLQLGQVREGLDLTLRVHGVPLRGVVRDVAGGTISGAVVFNDENSRTLSGEDGAFTLWSPPGSSSIVAAFAPGYTQDVVIARPPQFPVTLYLTPESVLRGRVIRSDTGAPLGGWAVHLRNEQLADDETADDGSFELRGLTPGRHKPYVRSTISSSRWRAWSSWRAASRTPTAAPNQTRSSPSATRWSATARSPTRPAASASRSSGATRSRPRSITSPRCVIPRSATSTATAAAMLSSSTEP